MEILLHKNLKKILEAKQLSPRELSQKTEVPLKTLYAWMDGPRVPRDLKRLKVVSEFLEVSLDEILFSSKPNYGQKIVIQGSKLEIEFTCGIV